MIALAALSAGVWGFFRFMRNFSEYQCAMQASRGNPPCDPSVPGSYKNYADEIFYG